MRHSRPLDVGVDVHNASSAVAYAPDERDAEGVFLGILGTRPCAIDQLVRQLTSHAKQRVFVYEAGPGGYWLYRDLTKSPRLCWGVAPALVPTKAGDRVTTDRRDATQLARLRRSRLSGAASSLGPSPSWLNSAT
jgi:transposase